MSETKAVYQQMTCGQLTRFLRGALRYAGEFVLAADHEKVTWRLAEDGRGYMCLASWARHLEDRYAYGIKGLCLCKVDVHVPEREPDLVCRALTTLENHLATYGVDTEKLARVPHSVSCYEWGSTFSYVAEVRVDDVVVPVKMLFQAET